MFVPSGINGLDAIIPGFPKGDLIIVAGRPGTGKTVFSASFIYNGAVKYGEKGLYISLSESRESFLQNMKSLGLDFEELEKRGLFEFVEFLTLREEGSRALLSEMVSIVEEIKPKRLVIDSFSAAVHHFKDPREIRVFLHTLFSKVIKRLNCTTILIEEIPYGESRIGYGFEEFVASAIIILRLRFIEGRLIRELTIPKLRGARIKVPVTCFTIHDGVTVFSPQKPIEVVMFNRFQPLPETAQRYSTGIKQLDEAIGGGIKRGSTVLVEVDPELTYEQYHLVVDPIMSNYVFSANRPLLVIPSAGVSWEDVVEHVKKWGITEDMIPKLIRVVEPIKEIYEELPPFVVAWEPNSPEKDFEKLIELENSLIESTQHPPLRFIGVDRVIHYHGPEGALTLANLDVTRTRKLGSLTIWLSKGIYPELLKRLIPLASIHLKLIERNGCLILYGLKPRTDFYFVELDESKGYPIPRLIPIK